MRTVNISLPDSLAIKVDDLLAQKEYASRSEVVRTALRVFLTIDEPVLVERESVFKRLTSNSAFLKEADKARKVAVNNPTKLINISKNYRNRK